MDMALIPLPLLGGGNRELPSAGTHLGACFSIILLGEQPYEYAGETGSRQQIHLGFELADQLMDDLRPFVISRQYSYSLHQNAAFRFDMESWLARRLTQADTDFDIASMVGRTAILGVQHRVSGDRTFANLTSIMAPPASAPSEK
jgi:hypothetical protein